MKRGWWAWGLGLLVLLLLLGPGPRGLWMALGAVAAVWVMAVDESRKAARREWEDHTWKRR